MKALSEILEKSREILSGDAYDVVHDYYHHYSVLENVFEIVTATKLKVDINKLTIATMFHDFETYYKEELKHKKLRTILTDISDEDFKYIVQIIDEHSLKSVQTLIESKILFDADKLEGISIFRWEYTLAAYHKDLISTEKLNKYIQVMNSNYIEIVENRLFFDYTKIRFAQKRDLFLSWAENKGLLEKGIFRIPT